MSSPESPASIEAGSSTAAIARRATLAAFCSSLVGIGLARFSYTPLLPAVINAGWFPASTATYLSAANLVGYLIGALLGRPMAQRTSARTVLRLSMLVTAVSLLACAWPVNFLWFFLWRVVSGITGGALMVLAAPTALLQVPPSRRGLASGLIFAGVGLGVAVAGTLVPLFIRQNLTSTWIGLSLVAFLLTALVWKSWPPSPKWTPARTAPSTSTPGAAAPSRPLLIVTTIYAINAVGLVPHMVFLVDYVARGLGRGIDVGASYWVVFGLGAMAGPVLTGYMTDRLGARRAMRLGFLLQAIAVALPAFGIVGHGALIVSSAVMGAFTPGISPLMIGRIRELLPNQPARHQPSWGRATTAFALVQAAVAYGMSWVLSVTNGDYAPIFMMATTALLVALAMDIVLLRKPRT